MKYLDLALWLNINPESSSMVHEMHPITSILSCSSYCWIDGLLKATASFLTDGHVL